MGSAVSNFTGVRDGTPARRQRVFTIMTYDMYIKWPMPIAPCKILCWLWVDSSPIDRPEGGNGRIAPWLRHWA